MSVQVSYRKQTIFGLIFIFLLLFFIEISINVYDYFTKSCKYEKNADAFANINDELKKQICHDFQDLAWGPIPFPYLEPNQSMKTININSDAFRGGEIEKIPNENFRIFIVGGSTVFGSGSTSDETTIPGYLQELFDNSNDYNVEIINAGIPGSQSTNELNRIKNNLEKYDPDGIVIYNGWNDLRESLKGLQQIQTSQNLSIYDEIENNLWYLLSKYRTIQVIQKFTYYSEDTDWEHRVIYEHNENEIDQKIKIWKSNMNEVCSSSDYETLIILQPISGSSNRSLSDFEYMKYLQNDGEKMNKTLDKYSESLKELDCKNTDDFTNVFDNVEGPIYYDEGHVTDRGNLIIAEKMFKVIQTKILS
tara:strand:- start:140 stop:1228 length:1089 start_codon:yes stop_codon:yes gene_type:complete